MILKISLRAKAGVPMNTCGTKTSPTLPVFPYEHAYVDCVSRGKLSDLNSIFRLRALCYSDRVLN